MTADIRSPLAAFNQRFADANDHPERIRLRELPFMAQWTLRTSGAPGDALPRVPNTTRSRAEETTLWMGPDEWLIVAEPGAAPSALEDEGVTLVDVSAQRTIIEVAGADARELLRKGCALDLHPESFAVGRCAQTILARAQVILLARHREPVYWVFVRASFAEYLAEWLLDAAAEYRGAPPSDLSLHTHLITEVR